MAIREFDLDELEEFRAGYDHVWSEEIYTGRWTRYDEVVFQADDDLCFYKIRVQTGLTEYQDVDGEDRFPDMEDGVLAAPEVERVDVFKLVTEWQEVQ